MNLDADQAVVEHEGLIRAIVSEYFPPPGLELEDLVQVGRVGVWVAVRDFRPDGGASLRNFVALCVRRQIITELKRATRAKHGPLNRSTSIDAPATDDGATLAEVLPLDGADPYTVLAGRDAARDVLHVLGGLSARDRGVLLDVGFLGLSYEETAGRAGLRDAKSVDNLLQRLRRALPSYDSIPPSPARPTTASRRADTRRGLTRAHSPKEARPTMTAIAAKLATVTPALAEQLLASNTRNRPLDLGRVAQYAADMRKGDWQVNGEAIKVAVDGTLLDGQHRLNAILEADSEVDMLIITGLPVETQETMDQGRARSFSDVLKLRGESDYCVLAAATRVVCIYERDGLPFVQGRARQPTVAQQSRTLERNPEIRASCAFVGKRRRGWLPVSATSALHYLFGIADAAGADDFFEKLTSGANLEQADAIYVLRERLIAERYDPDGGLSPKVTLAFLVRTWNAYQDGETLKRLVWQPGGASPDRFPAIRGLADPRPDEPASAVAA